MKMTLRLCVFLGLLGFSCSTFAAVQIVVSVDWEGRDLAEENLQAMQEFRKDFADVPLQHFLNAAYFTKPQADSKFVEQAIRSVIRKGDEEALHIHPWKSLVEASGVKFRTEPAFRGYLDLSKCDPDCGHDVNLASYSEPELRKLIQTSIKILTSHGFAHPKSFRAGAWQAEARTFRALAAEGFELDSSATHAEFLKERWGRSLLYPVVAKIWAGIEPTSQPYLMEPIAGKKLWELPNNGCLADYTPSDSIFKTFQLNAEQWKKDPQKDVFVSIGFHQETAKKYLSHVRDGIEKIKAYAQQEKIPVRFVVPPLVGLPR